MQHELSAVAVKRLQSLDMSVLIGCHLELFNYCPELAVIWTNEDQREFHRVTNWIAVPSWPLKCYIANFILIQCLLVKTQNKACKMIMFTFDWDDKRWNIFYKVITTKFWTWHKSCSVLLCAKIVLIYHLGIEWLQYDISINFELWWKNEYAMGHWTKLVSALQMIQSIICLDIIIDIYNSYYSI